MRPHKTKIDQGSPWRWYADPDPDRDYLAMATFIELRSVWDLPRFEWYTLRVHRQLARTPGLVGYSFRGEFPLRYWTLSAWENGRALHGLVRAGAHRTAMASVAKTMREFRHIHWPVTGSALPLAWSDGLHRLDRTNAPPGRPTRHRREDRALASDRPAWGGTAGQHLPAASGTEPADRATRFDLPMTG